MASRTAGSPQAVDKQKVRPPLPWAHVGRVDPKPQAQKAVAVQITVQWITTSWTKSSRGGDAVQQCRGNPRLVVPARHFNVAYGPVDRDVFLSVPTVLVDERGPVR